MADVTFKSSDGKDPEYVIQLLIEQVKAITPEKMMYAANQQIERIKARTLSGIDVNGGAFAGYSAKYAKTRERTGHPVTPVDLNFTGTMQASIKAEVRGKDSVAIMVTDPKAAVYGAAHNEGAPSRNLPQRRWFDTSQEELDEMTADLISGLV